jgi:hypothetical protein
MQFGTRIANKRVAGYVTLTPDVNVRDIVNQDFLVAQHKPSLFPTPSTADAGGVSSTSAYLCKKQNKRAKHK